MKNSTKIQSGALLCFVLADHVSAHPQPVRAIDSVRLVGADEAQRNEDSYTAGKRLLAADDAVGALAAFQRTLTVSPNSVDALNAIGVSYDQLGRADLARGFYEAGLAIDPTSPRLLNNLGYSLFLGGDWAAAITPLRAAAASLDVEAATAAQATLALIVAQTAPGWSPAVAVQPAPAARIELTNDGEQRLVFGPVDRNHADAMSDEATLASVAVAWTDRDDKALLDRVRGEEQAEQLALATAGKDRESKPVPAAVASPEAADQQVASLPAPAASTSNTVIAPVPARAVAAVILGETRADAALARRRALAENRREAAFTGSDPAPRLAAAFDSDDAELNAFAARVSAMAKFASDPVAPPSERITARFRT